VDVGVIVSAEIAVWVGVGSGEANAFPPTKKPKMPPISSRPAADKAMSQRGMTRIYAATPDCATMTLG